MDVAPLQDFRARFGGEPEVVAQAPGRVNLIGEHTDYNAGLVLPCAIDRATVVAARRRPDSAVRIYSREVGEEVRFDVDAGPGARAWLAYPAAVLAALRSDGIAAGGWDIAVGSDVPIASGLSSSAAFLLALVTAFDRVLGLGLDARERCRLAHRAECDFVGVPCGIMDSFASGLSRSDCLLRIDCRSEEVRSVPWPGERLRLLIVHSGVHRELAAGGYAERRRECEEALAVARASGVAPAGASALRDLEPQHLAALARALPATLFRRARHVISENVRVDATCAALLAGELAAAGAALCEGMRSLRDDFEVSTPELDALCELGASTPGVYGSRLTGAGFGGCTIHLVAPDASARAAARLADGFERRFGRRPPIWEARPAAGARVLE